MKRMRHALLLLIGLALLIPACGEPSREAQFKSNFEEAIQAAEKGKEAVKPSGKRR
jgi:hypothetical protein